MCEAASSAGDTEFPGIPSTQEWHEDFPSTQIPICNSRAAYITPATSFTIPSNDSELDGFDVRVLVGMPQTPVRVSNESLQMPPTPLSVPKREMNIKTNAASRDGLGVQADKAIEGISTLGFGAVPASSLQDSKKANMAKNVQVHGRKRKRPRKRGRTIQPSPTQIKQEAIDPIPAPHLSSTPELWPVPFPQADKGIYPDLPPAQQFEQMVTFTSATEEHIDKWDLHTGTYPVPLLREVLSAQECIHMGFYSQLEQLDKQLREFEEMMRPISAKERSKMVEWGERYKTVTPQMWEKVKRMRSITKQRPVCFYESRIPTRLRLRRYSIKQSRC
jgi:hypothetical protein